MLATIRDDTWNMLKMQHITPIRKHGIIQISPVMAMKILKDPPTWLKVATTLEKPPPPHPHWLYRINDTLPPGRFLTTYAILGLRNNRKCKYMLHFPENILQILRTKVLPFGWQQTVASMDPTEYGPSLCRTTISILAISIGSTSGTSCWELPSVPICN